MEGVYTVRSEKEFKELIKKLFYEDFQGKYNTIFETQIGVVNILQLPAPTIQVP